MVKKYDVVILGGGLAGNAFARHLKLTDRDISVLIVGKKEVPKFTVGESATELASHYLQHRLKLTSYMYRNQLVKQGIRMFYDSEKKNQRLQDMSEEGTGAPALFNTFHVDRFHIEKDLQEMNERELGVEFLEDLVEKVTFETDVNVVDTKKKNRIGARWIVDATGRFRFLARKLELHKEVENNHHCSAWVHCKAKNNIDTTDQNWRRKNQFTTRELSTIHFVYEHYWFWVIPLRDDIISCGVVYDKRYLFKDGPPSQEQLVRFIDQHEALGSIFEKNDIVNYRAVENFSYTSKEFVNLEKRYMLLGDAGAFVDPLYSSGMDVLGQESDFFLEIIQKDLGGMSKEELLALVDKANVLAERAYYHYRSLILGKFACMGSCEIFGAKYFFEFFVYFVFKLWGYVSQKSISELYSQIDETQKVLELVTNNFMVLAARYKDQGIYFRKNAQWRQGAKLGIFTEFITHSKLNDRLSRQRTFIVQDLAKYMLLLQAEMYFKRKDLVCDETLYRMLSYEKILEYSQECLHDEHCFFRDMEKIIDDGVDGPDFYNAWITKITSGSETLCGKNFEKLKKGLPRFDFEERDVDRYEKMLGQVVSSLKQAKTEPKIALSKLDKEDHLAPFVIEGVACGLAHRGISIEKVKSEISLVVGEQYSPLVLAGYAMGIKESERIIDFSSLSKNEIKWFLNGYGFQMGLARFYSHDDILFPNESQRKHIVVGLGRSVTFIPNELNVPLKYEKYFNCFELYPQDADAFYHGAGFSLAFTKSPTELAQFTAHYSLEFPHCNRSFEDGIQEAIQYKAKLLPDIFFPIAISLHEKLHKAHSAFVLS